MRDFLFLYFPCLALVIFDYCGVVIKVLFVS